MSTMDLLDESESEIRLTVFGPSVHELYDLIEVTDSNITSESPSIGNQHRYQ